MDEYGPGEHLLSLVHHGKKGLPGAGEVAEHLKLFLSRNNFKVPLWEI